MKILGLLPDTIKFSIQIISSQDFEDESDFPKTSFKNMMYGTKFNARIHVKYLKINLHIIFSICIVVQSFKIAV